MPEPTNKTDTLADHKSRVMEAAKAHAEAQKVAARASNTRPPDGFPLPPTAQPQIPEFMQKMGVQAPPAPEVQPKPPAAPQNAAPPPQNGNQEPEWQKVSRERGWKTPDDAVKSYLDLEKAWFAKLNERSAERNQPPPPPMPPQAVPRYQPPAPAWTPPPLPLAQQMARRHGISVEDAERLLPFVAEVANAMTSDAVIAERQRYEPVIMDLNRKVRRSEEVMEVAQDPAMRVPRVQYEVSQILNENPSVFSTEPAPMRWALDKALRKIAQESLGAYQPQGGGSEPGYPMTPPVTAGGGAGSSGRGAAVSEPSVDLAGSYFKLKTAAEKKDFLRQMGVAAE